ncbi:MAG TPA: DUF3574 domain-containing protein [Candidatus Limnocylindria bacterium]|jgi:hypothetical protein|nr:DUF3574 domain-containing protein [Candidatus Limnocylindria bacterium]
MPTRDRRRPGAALLLLTAALLLAGCTTPKHTAPTDRPAAATAWVRTELYFGAVEPALWSQFLAEAVTPRFPSGLTVLEAQGQWRGRDEQVHKVPTRILVILHPGSRETNASLDAIRREFIARFHHESVLRTDTGASVSF